MENVSLQAESRTITGKHVNRLRKSGLLPGVIYGHKKENQSISLNAREFAKLYEKTGNSTLLTLTVDGKSAGKVLVHEVQTDPVKRTLTHVDLFAVNLKEKLRTEIALEFIGTSEAVELLGGTLMTVKDEIEVECLPDKLVSEIQVDISALKTFDDTIKVGDLAIPEGITILTESDELIVSVTEPRSEEDMAELDSAVEDTTAEVVSETGTEPVTDEEPDTTEK